MAITYAKFVSPVLFFLFNFSCLLTGPTFHPDSPLFATEMSLTLVGLVVDVIARGLLFWGALLFNSQRRQGSGLMTAGGWILCLGSATMLAIHLLFAISTAGVGEEHRIETTDDGAALVCFLIPVAIGELMYLVYILVVLHGYRSHRE